MVEETEKGSWGKAVAVCVIAAVVTTAVGCGGADTGGRVPLAGEVTLDGAPLDSGTIEFHGAGGGDIAGGRIQEGRFEIPAERGVTPGSYEVRIYSEGEMTEPEVDPNEPPGPEAGRQVAAERIPDRYNTETELEATVGDEGATDLRFDLES